MSISDWHTYSATIAMESDAFIDGRFTALQDERFDKSSPVDGRYLASVVEAGATGVDVAVRSARDAFNAGLWSRADPRFRRSRMLAWAAGIRSAREELATIVTLEMGKPISDALGEVEYAAGVIEFYAEAIDKSYGEIAPTPTTALALISKEPLGVIGLVLPWNFPLSLATWKLGPALAAGNSCIVKPAEQTPLSALILARIATESGIPDGVLNVVPGHGETTGQALGLHMDVDKISFTGSSQIGKLFLRYSGESNMKSVSIEGGGKSPNIVLADAPDLGRAARAAATAICMNAGQSCSAGSRLLVDRPIAAEFTKLVAEHMAEWVPADPLLPGTTLGAVVDEIQMNRVLGYIHQGTEEGANICTGGSRVREKSGGFYVEPTLLSGVDNASSVAQEEIFGPVLAAVEVDGLEDAVRVANDTKYGLAAAIWTRDVTRAHQTARALRAGTVYVNCYDDSDINVTFGGFGESGIGIDKSLHAIDKYTQFKTTWVDLQSEGA